MCFRGRHQHVILYQNLLLSLTLYECASITMELFSWDLRPWHLGTAHRNRIDRRCRGFALKCAGSKNATVSQG